MTAETIPDHELDVLSQIHADTDVKQRDIAHAIGLSLGMTNSILKRLATKGFLSVRRINSRNVHYLVTPAGVELIAKRSYRYLRRTVGHVVRYKERLWHLLNEAAAPDAACPVTGVVLAGASDIDFVVEWCAAKVGLAFRRVECTPDAAVCPTLARQGDRAPATHGGESARPHPEGDCPTLARNRDCDTPAREGELTIAAESLPIDCPCDVHLAQLVLQAKR